MPVDQKCVEALYNYLIALGNVVENTEMQRRSNDVGQYAYGMVGRNANADLLDYWSSQIEERCEVSWDEKTADRFGQIQETELIGALRSMFRDITGKSLDEMEAEEKKKETEARAMIYG